MTYLRIFTVILACLLISVAAINWVVDPYGLLGSPVRQGFNDAKQTNHRLAKPVQVTGVKAETVLFGTSRVMHGLDPGSIPEQHIYNFGIPAVTMREMAFYARHVLSLKGTRTLVLGLDYVSFDDDAPPRPGFDPTLKGPWARWQAMPTLLFSGKAMSKSRSVMRASAKGEISGLSPNGYFPLESGDGVTAQGGASYAQIAGRIRSAEESLLQLDEVLAQAQAQGIRTIVFIPPLHAAAMEALVLGGQRPAYEAWMRRVVEMGERRDCPVWDFSGWNTRTAMPMSRSQEDFTDTGHFRSNVGASILATLLGNRIETGFGERLSSHGLDAYLNRQRAARAAWAVTNSDDAGKVRAAVLAAH